MIIHTAVTAHEKFPRFSIYRSVATPENINHAVPTWYYQGYCIIHVDHVHDMHEICRRSHNCSVWKARVRFFFFFFFFFLVFLASSLRMETRRWTTQFF